MRRSDRVWVVLLVVILAATCRVPAQQQAGASQNASTSIVVRRVSHLQRGINLSEWFAQVYDPKGYTKEHFQSWTTAQDIALIAQLGFDHVRLGVNPQPMFRGGHADEIPPDYLSYLDSAIKMILDRGLAVIVDIHPDSDFKAKLASDDFVEQFADYWRALAKHYSTLDPDRVFFEILNEPELTDRYRWYGIQSKLAAAIRDGAPQHTIIATGARWSDDDDLLFLKPLRDPNVIYSFHFYSPHVFTHQSATWSVNYWHFVHGLAYPSNPESARKAADTVPDAPNRLQVIRYGLDHWDATHIDAEIEQVADWARPQGLVITCNEFGVYRKGAAPDDRARWLNDVRTSLERHGIGWTMWDYSGGFGLRDKDSGKPEPDPAILRALGLKPLP